jgi:hypothetical protein
MVIHKADISVWKGATMRKVRLAFFLLLACATVGLLACGGGDGDGTTNTAPVADAGADQSVTICSTAALNGSGSSDAEGDALTFNWSLVTAPAGSLAEISGASSANASFMPDVPGTYVASLTVSDGTASGAADTVTITASEGAATVSFATDIQPIFDTNCIVCHAVDFSGTDASFMPLTSDVSYGNLVNIRDTNTDPGTGFTSDFRVKRCVSEESVLFQRVDSTTARMASYEATMPMGSSPLPLGDQAAIQTWIDQGALDY